MEMKKFILPLLGVLGLLASAIAYADMFPINKHKSMVEKLHTPTADDKATMGGKCPPFC